MAPVWARLCVCVCVCACVRACVRVCVRVGAHRPSKAMLARRAQARPRGGGRTASAAGGHYAARRGRGAAGRRVHVRVEPQRDAPCRQRPACCFWRSSVLEPPCPRIVIATLDSVCGLGFTPVQRGVRSAASTALCLTPTVCALTRCAPTWQGRDDGRRAQHARERLLR